MGQQSKSIGSTASRLHTNVADKLYQQYCWSIQFVPGHSDQLMISSAEGDVLHWSAYGGTQATTLATYMSAVDYITLSCDGTLAASSSQGQLQVHALSSGVQLLKVEPADGFR